MTSLLSSEGATRPSRPQVFSLAEAFERYVTEAPDDLALVCNDDGGDALRLDRRDLARRVYGTAQALTAAGVRPSDRVVLALPTSVEFVAAFWALQLLGASAAPTPAFEGRGKQEARLAQLAQVCEIVTPRLVIVGQDAADWAGRALPAPVAPVSALQARADSAPVTGTPDALGVLQFTSGSTGAPRGCALTQRALLTNAEAIVERMTIARGDTAVSWLPLYHDMGLMTGVMLPVAAGGAAQLRASARFLVNPLSWLKDLTAHARTHTAAPNFALALVLQRLARRPPEDLDLSGVVSLVCGAEPIDPELARRFVAALSPFGLRPEAFHAAYGMAEATLLVTSRPGGVAASPSPAVEGGEAPIEVANLGRPGAGVSIEVLNRAGEPVLDGAVGEVVVTSPSLMEGYYNNPEATGPVLRDGRFWTGDLGFLRGGELHVVGRLKDIIIASGRNLYPSDIEYAVARALDVAPSRVAAVGLRGAAGTEDVHLVVEARVGDEDEAWRRRAVTACYEVCGVAPQSVRFVSSGAIPRTTSGKIRRSTLKTALVDGAMASES